MNYYIGVIHFHNDTTTCRLIQSETYQQAREKFALYVKVNYNTFDDGSKKIIARWYDVFETIK